MKKAVFFSLILLVGMVSSVSAQSTIDDFEDGDLSEYGIFGNSDGAEVTSQYAFEGSYSANVTAFGGNYEVIASTSGLNRYYSQGDGNLSIRVREGTSDQETTFGIGQSDESSQSFQGAVVWDSSGTEIIDDSFNQLGSTSWTDLSGQWAEWKINWMENGTMKAWIYDNQGNLQGELSGNIGTSTNSGILMKVNSPNSGGSVGSVFFDQIQLESSGSGGGSTNTAPSVSDYNPSDGATGVNDTFDSSPVDVNVSATVTDDENSTLNVYAYRDGVFQEKKTGVSNNTEIEFVFENLSSGTSYDWNLKVGDEVTNTTTPNRTFTTELSGSVSDRSLEGEYHFNETSSPSLDFSGNNRDLTWKNTSLLSGTSSGYSDSGGTWYDGRAIDFQNGGYLLSDNTGFDITNEASTVAWVNVDQAGGTSYNRFLSYDDVHAGGSSQAGIYWDADDDKRGALGGVTASGDITTGSWVCVASAYDGSNAYYYEMENGESSIQLEASGSLSLSMDGDEKLAIGARSDSGNYIDARVDEPKMFSENLSKTQLQSICNTNSIEETPPSPTPNVTLQNPVDGATVESPANASVQIEFFDALDRIELWTNSSSDATNYGISQNSRTTLGTDSGTQDHFSRPVYAETVTGKDLVFYRQAQGHGVEMGDKWHLRCRDNFSDSWSSPDTYCNGTAIPGMPFDSGLGDQDADISIAPNGSVNADFFRYNSNGNLVGSYQIYAGKKGFNWNTNGENLTYTNNPYDPKNVIFGQDHTVVGDKYWKTAYMQADNYQNSMLYLSTDNGQTYEFIANLSDSSEVNTNEASISPINNSAYLVVMRSNDGTGTYQRKVLQNGSSMTSIKDISSTKVGHFDRPRTIKLSTGDIAMVGKDKSPANSVGFGVYDVESDSWDYYNQFTSSYGDAGYADVLESDISQKVSVASYTGDHQASDAEEWKFDLSYDESGWGKKTEKTSGLGGNNSVSWIESQFSDGSYLWNIKAVQSDGESSFADQNRTFTVSTADTTPPTSSDNWTETGFVDKSGTDVEITATDSESSVANISYRVNGGSWTTVSGSTATVSITNQGNNTLEYYAVDTKGNNESINTEYVAINGLYAGGAGTLSNPFEISTCTELQNITKELDNSFELVNDIDCSDSVNWNGGKGFYPIKNLTAANSDLLSLDNSFQGTFSGRGYVVENLYIDRPNQDYIGLFGKIDNQAEITTVGLENVSITGDELVGGLVAVSLSDVSRSYVEGSVEGNSSVGGLVGKQVGVLKNSYSNVNVTGNSKIGGLVGVAEGNTEFSYRKIESAYASGSVNGDSNVGGVIGYAFDNLITEKLYWDTDKSGTEKAIGNNESTAVGLSTDRMTGSIPNCGSMNLDFSNIWITVKNDYPEVRVFTDKTNNLVCPADFISTRVTWNQSVSKTVSYRYASNSDVKNVSSPNNGVLFSSDNTSTVIESWSSPFNWFAKIYDSVPQPGAQREINFTTSSGLLIENKTGVFNETHQTVYTQLNLTIGGEEMNFTLDAADPTNLISTVQDGFTASNTAATGLHTATWYWRVDSIYTQLYNEVEVPNFNHNTTTQRIKRNKSLGNSISTNYTRLSVTNPAISGTLLNSSQTISLNGNTEKNLTYYGEGDFINEKEYDFKPVDNSVVLGINYIGSRKLELENTLSTKFTDVNTAASISTPNGCSQTNNSIVNVSSNMFSNKTVEFSCDPGNISGGLTQFTENDANNDTWYFWNSTSVDIKSNETSETTIIKVLNEDDDLNDWDNRKGDEELYCNGNRLNDSVWDYTDTPNNVRLSFYPNSSCGSSLTTSTSSIAFKYEVGSADTTDPSPGGGGGGGTPSSDELTVYFDEQDDNVSSFDVPFGENVTRNITVTNRREAEVTATLSVGSDGACRFVSVQRSLTSDEFGDSGTYRLPRATDTLGTVESKTGVPVRFSVPNVTVLEENGFSSDSLSCGFSTDSSYGVAEDLSVEMNREFSLLRFVRGLLGPLNDVRLFSFPTGDVDSRGAELDASVSLGDVVLVGVPLFLVGLVVWRRSDS